MTHSKHDERLLRKEMLAAGLTAAAAAIIATPKARRKIRDAGLDAADKASQTASATMTNASKLGALIAEAVAEAAQRVLSDDWRGVEKDASASKPVTPRRKIHEATITEEIKLSSSAEAELVSQVETMLAQSGAPEHLDASKWVHEWVRHEVPALNGRRPIDLLDSSAGRELVSKTLAQMQSGAYA